MNYALILYKNNIQLVTNNNLLQEDMSVNPL